MNTQTAQTYGLALLLAGFMAFALPSCSKKYDGNHVGKYAGREVCAVCEEITQEEFNIALADKEKYNVYPVRKKLTNQAYQNVRQQIDVLIKNAQKDSINLLGSYYDTQNYSIENDETSHIVLYYPNSNDYLVWMELGCIWCGAALFNEKGELDPTIITAGEHISRSTDNIFACSPCFDCDFHAEIHFFEKSNGHLRKLCRYNAHSWLQGEMINYDSTMFWYKDDLYCSGYSMDDYYSGWYKFIENWRETTKPPYDQSEEHSIFANYFKNVQRFYRIRLISPEEKAKIDRNVNTVYSRACQEDEIYDDPRWDMFVRGDLQPNVCAFICNIALISDGGLTEIFGGHLYEILKANKENNDKLKQYISTLPDEKQQRILEIVLGSMSLDLWENKENGRKYENYDTLVRDFPLLDNQYTRMEYKMMNDSSYWELYYHNPLQ